MPRTPRKYGEVGSASGRCRYAGYGTFLLGALGGCRHWIGAQVSSCESTVVALPPIVVIIHSFSP
jgi:hypothetical protein